MAGKKHHHLWQMLQRGFAEREGKQHYTFVYSTCGDPERKNTREFGVEEYFYGPEGSVADENITDFELRSERLIQALRRAPDGHQADGDAIAALVNHLEMRSFFLRSEMIRLSDEMMGALKGHLSYPSKIKALIVAYVKKHPGLLEGEIDKLKLLPEDRNLAEGYADSKLPSLIEQASPSLAKQFTEILTALGPEMVNAAKNAHIRLLERDFFTVERNQLYKRWSFFVRRYEGGGLILPDTAVAFLSDERCAPFSQKGSAFTDVVVPLSDQVAVIGTSKKSIDRPLDVLNRILASCSYQAFAASHDVASLRKLTRRIAKNAELLTKGELRQIFSFQDMLDRL